MSNEIAVLSNEVRAMLRAQADDELRDSGNMCRISIKHSRFQIGGIAVKDDFLDVVILTGGFYNELYLEKYINGRMDPPDCAAKSLKKTTLAPYTQQKMNVTCDGCKYNDWDDKPNKICKNRRLLIVTPADQSMMGILYQIKLPVTSGGNFQKYHAQTIQTTGYPLNGFITRVRVVDDPKNQYMVTFERLGYLNEQLVLKAIDAKKVADKIFMSKEAEENTAESEDVPF